MRRLRGVLRCICAQGARFFARLLLGSLLHFR